MAGMIVPTEIGGGSVYGVKQVQYSVDGEAGQDYIYALTKAAFKESVAIEEAASAYSEVVRLRQKKTEELGWVLAILAKALATMNPKSNDKNKKSDSDSNLVTARDICSKYGLSLSLSGSQVTFQNASKSQNEVQYALDVEDNNLQQDSVSMQSYLTKRDNAFSTAAKLVKKVVDSAASTIGNMG